MEIAKTKTDGTDDLTIFDHLILKIFVTSRNQQEHYWIGQWHGIQATKSIGKPNLNLSGYL